MADLDIKNVRRTDFYINLAIYTKEGLGDRSPKDYLRIVSEVRYQGTRREPLIYFEDDKEPQTISGNDFLRGGGSHGIFLRKNERGKLEVVAASETISAVLDFA